MGGLRTGTIALGLLALSSRALADDDAYEPSRFRVYAGPALWDGDGAGGAVESLVELGVRFR